MSNRTIHDLMQKQSLPLSAKIKLTQSRIREWVNEYGEDGVYVSFSGGKDSTVLLDIVRNVCGYKDVKAMFVDVPTQYPELRDFAKTFDNVDIVHPKISFMEVCEKYGFPIISKEVSECVEGARKYLKTLDEYIVRQDSLSKQASNDTPTSTTSCKELENTVNFQFPPLIQAFWKKPILIQLEGVRQQVS